MQIYEELLKITASLSKNVNAERKVYYSHGVNDSVKIWGFNVMKKVQKGSDLGERMFAAFEVELTEYKKCILIGSDCAELTSEIIDMGYMMLDKADIVIGPTYDGGYYLIGMKSAYWQIFSGIDWSTEEVFGQSLAAIERLNLSVVKLPLLSDIDYEEDWVKFLTMKNHLL